MDLSNGGNGSWVRLWWKRKLGLCFGRIGNRNLRRRPLSGTKGTPENATKGTVGAHRWTKRQRNSLVGRKKKRENVWKGQG
ncbi:unnamed protein product [Linum tenue]|uniref:Uncharacterized protein n=1 Tax=Linum tenue TaxID=586396 RepID=A0AAV0JXB3_9ROSI|nr:unnamed protein product [Linum tenue]